MSFPEQYKPSKPDAALCVIFQTVVVGLRISFKYMT